MFVQVIKGQVGDPAGAVAALERWGQEVRPGAVGFLGSTGGVTADGRFVALARFETAEAAQANAERPEQGEWWAATERCFTGPVSFLDCTEVDVFGSGGSDRAGFVQVMAGHGDRNRLRALDATFEDRLTELRPDLLGSVRAWHDDEYTEAAYFTSESDARAAESQDPPPDAAAMLAVWQQAMGPVTYYDLAAPHLVS
jgi:hypothetical protein